MISLRNILTQRNLLDRIDSYAIFAAYCKNFKEIGKNFSSEFRPDPHPSCRIEFIGGDLLYSDFGEGTYRAIPYVMRKYNLSRRDALRKINFDFGLGLMDTTNSKAIFPTTNVKIKERPAIIAKEKTDTIIKVKYSGFTADELRFWDSNGWTFDMLQRASIRSISSFWITMEHKGIIDIPFNVSGEMAFSFDYYEHNGIYRRKLYFPQREGNRRFISNVDNSIIQNWDLLPKSGGDLLFVTSSKKDTGALWHINGHYCNACAPNSEMCFLQEEVFYTKIKPRWKRIIYYGDNDTVGVKQALKWSKMYRIEAIWNPLSAPKDPSDLWRKDGGREFNYQLQKLINYGGK